jgi:hypothetical protein
VLTSMCTYGEISHTNLRAMPGLLCLPGVRCGPSKRACRKEGHRHLIITGLLLCAPLSFCVLLLHCTGKRRTYRQLLREGCIVCDRCAEA